jgi:hypothetical protein
MSDSEEERGLLSPKPNKVTPAHALMSEDDAATELDEYDVSGKGVWKWRGPKAREWRRMIDLAAPLCLSYFAVNISESNVLL